MAQLRFPEQTGTLTDDTLFATSNQITYGLAGNDTLQAAWGIQYSFLLGGSGDDVYEAAASGATTIMDTGGTDTIIAKGLGITNPETYVATVDGRHLLALDLVSGQQVAVADWENPQTRIEQIVLGDGTYSHSQIQSAVANSPNYLGNISSEMLAEYGFLPSGTTQADLAELIDYVTARESELTTNLSSATDEPDPTRTESHLAEYGVSKAAAYDFIVTHLGSPDTILNVASDFGLDTSMLAEVVQYGLPHITTLNVIEFFESTGLDPLALDVNAAGEFAYGDHRYVVVDESMDWESAKQAAESYISPIDGKSGQLAVIDSAEENQYLLQQALRQLDLNALPTADDGGGAPYLWLGGNDMTTEGAWEWVDGATISLDPNSGSYSNWGTGTTADGLTHQEPDNFDNQDALGMALTDWPNSSTADFTLGEVGQWNDIDTTNPMPYFIEIA